LTESQIQKQILDWLEARAIVAWRVPLGSVRGRRGKHPMKGFPDIAGVLPGARGRLFAIEVKKPKSGRVAPHQEDWISRLAEAGAATLIARSLDDVVNFFSRKEQHENDSPTVLSSHLVEGRARPV
jgi:hypothetical protein